MHANTEVRSHGCTDVCANVRDEQDILGAHGRSYGHTCLEMCAMAEARTYECMHVRTNDRDKGDSLEA